MERNHRKLRVFHIADSLILDIYAIYRMLRTWMTLSIHTFTILQPYRSW